MTEQRRDSPIDILRSRFGPRFQSDMDHGRDEIVRVLRDELHLGADEAETMVRQMIEDGRLRYVPAVERDPEVDRDAQYDERSDIANRRAVGDPADSTGDLPINPLPAQGGPQEGYSGLKAVPAAPVSSTGSGIPAAVPVAADVTGPDMSGRHGPGYWDIGGEAVGVMPSETRKGQVEPAGT